MRTPVAPKEKLVPCKICGKPDYLEGLCYSHYIQLKRGYIPKPHYTERQQDIDRKRFETKDCGCALYPEDYHGWDCALNASAEVGQEYIFDPVGER